MGIRIVDTAWHTLYANHVYLDMFGYKNIAEIGRTSLQDHYTPEEKARYRERMARKQHGETVPDNPKVDIIDKDGTVRRSLFIPTLFCGTARSKRSSSIMMLPSVRKRRKPSKYPSRISAIRWTVR